MKAIETAYRGYRFRSRLEARWAIYFDEIGIEWEYEPEGFEFDNGIRYLPDFFFPQVKLWGEVKAGRFSQKELEKVKMLVKGTEQSCILLEGTPDERSYALVGKATDSDEIIVGEESGYDCVISMYHNYPRDEGRFYTHTGGLTEADFEWNGLFDDVREAVHSARSARFEFGENGKSPTSR
ncbi:hypothetical protein QEH52_19100 [Coraliomargarita sp. SDUM461003]|uniref:Uncharacterized protein n=1 Tax=Thalassobacterium maritimum TaxID=3041265 RepID=A0ABU1AZS7_9BACT|nr:hypothetical protein [Coraliomargarita sp. SDUM461003]MDQ8209635.1 hypothetical protein [Coraliomargarita sp. SDUM461003]